jgi:hypothetical protein
VGEPNTTTLSATNIDTDSATLRGEVDPNGDNIDDVWFEYGTNENNLNRTVHVTNYDDNESQDTFSFSKSISNLNENEEYFFRACTENSHGDDCGSIKSFTTDNENNSNNNSNNSYNYQYPYIPQPTTIYHTTVVNNGGGSVSSKVELNIEARFDTAYAGDTIDYLVTYKNISRSNLHNAVLHIELPEDVDFRNSNKGSYNSHDNTLTLELDTLSPKESGQVTMSVRVSNSIKRSSLTTKAILAYTLASGAQESATDFSTIRVNGVDGSVLGANAFSAGFLPHTLGQWLLTILLIFGIVALSRFYMKKD